MQAATDFGGRRAPYAPISALEGFLEKIRDRSVPEHVDHRFLKKLNVASNNEYALLSALKFLGVLDDRGRPTHAYRLLQTTDRFRETLRHLVETAYRPVFESGADTWSMDDLVNFFRTQSSASQAKNAARFYLAVCRLAGIDTGPRHVSSQHVADDSPDIRPSGVPQRHDEILSEQSPELLAAKARLLEKLPAPRLEWSAAEYTEICRLFLEMLHTLEAS